MRLFDKYLEVYSVTSNSKKKSEISKALNIIIKFLFEGKYSSYGFLTFKAEKRGDIEARKYLKKLKTISLQETKDKVAKFGTIKDLWLAHSQSRLVLSSLYDLLE
ncbi:MAG: hypothetical protein MRY57_02540 [Candidatus Pacebacteria bacterium]|nr:hypothetical protein [Candidatus Paceibacterota bacterium]